MKKIEEALRLYDCSRSTLEPVPETDTCEVDNIYTTIIDCFKREGGKKVKIEKLKQICRDSGFSHDNIDRVIEDYVNLDIFRLNKKLTKLSLVE